MSEWFTINRYDKPGCPKFYAHRVIHVMPDRRPVYENCGTGEELQANHCGEVINLLPLCDDIPGEEPVYVHESELSAYGIDLNKPKDSDDAYVYYSSTMLNPEPAPGVK